MMHILMRQPYLTHDMCGTSLQPLVGKMGDADMSRHTMTCKCFVSRSARVKSVLSCMTWQQGHSLLGCVSLQLSVHRAE